MALAGCSKGNSKPEDVSQDYYDIGVHVLEILDDYKDRKITGDEVFLKMDDEEQRLSDHTSSEKESDIYDAVHRLHSIFGHTGREMKEINEQYNKIKAAIGQ